MRNKSRQDTHRLYISERKCHFSILLEKHTLKRSLHYVEVILREHRKEWYWQEELFATQSLYRMIRYTSSSYKAIR